jgi:hypothetical protein
MSLRVPQLPPGDRLTLQLRYLISFTDRSEFVFGTWLYEATDALTLFLSTSLTFGPRYGELSRLVRGGAVLGAVYAM